MRHMFFRSLLVFIGWVLSNFASAQTLPQVVAGHGTGNTGWDVALGLVTDNAGRYYTTGHFVGTVDFDPGVGIANLSDAGVYGGAFVACYDTSESFRWVVPVSGSGHDGGYAICYDGGEYLYTTGVFTGANVDFDPGPGTFLLTTPSGSSNIYVMKLDTAGNFIWAVGIGAGGVNNGTDIIISRSGDIIITGQFSGNNIDFDPAVGTALLSSGSFSNPANFLLKLDSSGNYLNAVVLGLGADPNGMSNVVEDVNGNVFVTASFANPSDFNPGPGTAMETSQDYYDVFIVKLDSQWNYVWHGVIGGASGQYPSAIECDSSGNVYVGGWFQGTVDFDPGSGAYSVVGPIGSILAGFIFKLNAQGLFGWMKQIGPTNYGTYVYDITCDSKQKIYFTGGVWGSQDLDPCSGVLNVSTGSGSYVIEKLNPDGSLIWGCAGSGAGNAIGYEIVIDSTNAILLAGTFQANHDFGPGFSSFNITSNGGHEIFSIRMRQCTETTSYTTITACGSYTLPGGCSHNQSGTYYYTLVNAAGCDSIIEVNATIAGLELSVGVTGDSIFSNDTNGIYQWIDCANGNVIAGATSQFFVPTTNGAYAVIVDNGVCSDTSSCVQILSVNTSDYSSNEGMELFPNPADEFLMVRADFNDAAISVHDLTGRLLFSADHVSGSSFRLETASFACGVYVISINRNGNVDREMFVIE